MKEYIKNEIKLLPIIIVLFIIFSVVVNLINGKPLNVKKNYNKQKDVFTVGDINSSYACINGNYSTYNNRLATINGKIGTGTLTTTNKTLVGGINEIRARLLTSSAYTLPIIKGGTGATTAAGARSNLEVPTPSSLPTVTTASKTAKGITISYKKWGKVVSVSFSGDSLTSSLASDSTILATLESAYRPPAVVVFPCFSNQNGSSYKDVIYMFIRATGDIKVHTDVDSGHNLYCSVAYMTS